MYVCACDYVHRYNTILQIHASYAALYIVSIKKSIVINGIFRADII